MHNTIWLLAFILQLFAKNSGSFPNGTITAIPMKKKIMIKKGSCVNRKKSPDPKRMMNIGASIANDTAPLGVMLRWQG